MNKESQIIFAFQTWSEQYKWWIPNTNPPDLRIDGKSIAPTTHYFQWYDISGGLYNVDLTLDKMTKMDPVRNDYMYNYKNVTYNKLDDVRGKKYIYPVMIHTADYFSKQEQIGFKFVDPNVLDDVKNNRAKIVLMLPYEGHGNLPNYDDFKILNKWCIDNNLTKNQVYYLSGELNGPTDVNYTYIGVNGFRRWVPKPQPGVVSFNPDIDKNLFLSYTRRPHDHRLLFTCNLIKYDLLKHGLISYYGGKEKNSVARVHQLGREDLAKFAKRLDKTRPIILDIKDLGYNNPASNVNKLHHIKTFMSVVLETHYNPTTLFFSEKIWKPISMGHPFMLIAGNNYLTELKRLGYQTFDKWLDERYDQTSDINDKIELITSEIKRLSNLSIDDLKKIREEMMPILIHNQNLFIEQWDAESPGPNNNSTGIEFLYKEITKIWESF